MLDTTSRQFHLLLYNPYFQRSSARRANWNASDGTWVEVTRINSDCAQVNSLLVGDGLMPLPRNYTTRVVNGCWFWVAPGSGVWLNVGRSLRMPSRHALDHLVVGVKNALTRFDANWIDQRWCGWARARGYDSVQVGVEMDHLSPRVRYTKHASGAVRDSAELVVCGGGCAMQHVRSACPPIPLRTGLRAQLPCLCDSRHAMINCGNLQHIQCALAGKQLAWWNKVGHKYATGQRLPPYAVHAV